MNNKDVYIGKPLYGDYYIPSTIPVNKYIHYFNFHNNPVGKVDMIIIIYILKMRKLYTRNF